MVSDFSVYKQALFDEFRAFFSQYPLPMEELQRELDEMIRKIDSPYPYEKKALVYKAAVRCQVQVFRNSPFYFEIHSGRIRNSSQNGFPPGPGLEGWYMRQHCEIADEFSSWLSQYQNIGLVWGAIFSDFAHHAAGYDRLLRLGFLGIAAEARTEREKTGDLQKISFYNAILTACESMKELGCNFSRRAWEMLNTETDPELRKNLTVIAENASRVPYEPASTFYDALETILFAREIITSLEGVAIAVLGHLDRLLYPFYRSDIDKGTLTKSEAKNLLAHFLTITDARWDLDVDFASTNNSLTIGGCDAAGQTVWNDVSRLILEIYEEHGFVNPKIQVRISSKYPKEEISQCCRMIAGGNNIFSFLNDDILIPAHVKQGKKPADARQYSAGGCQEPILDNCEFNSRAFLYINLPQLANSFFDDELNIFFKNERLPYRNRFTAFEDLYSEYFRRLNFLFTKIAETLNHYEGYLPLYNPCPLLSSTMEDCIMAGKDMTEGGTRYNPTSLPLVGISTAIDSLLAIREVVFEKKMMDLAKLGALLKSDFAENKLIHQYLMHRCPKFGSDEPEQNHFAAQFFQDAARATSGIPNARGGMYEASLFVFYLFDWMKIHTGATADGRRAGTVLSRGMSPSDISGVGNIASILHTIHELDLTDYPGAGVVYLEMPLSNNHINDSHLSTVVEAFGKCGGSALDLNLLDAEKLRKAKENPETHRNIVVRVCGFSAYFTSLAPNIQDEIIARTLYGNE
jgi:formate C-acetyltransferase